MNDVERKFLLAVERGDLAKLKILLSSNDRRLNINCCDPLARNALVIAIDNENLEMVKLLIEAKIKIGDALLYAIDENFVEAVELLLDHEEATVKPGSLHSWEQNREDSSFSADLTPLILAAHGNNFEIIKILLDRRVSPIPDPHEPRCDCTSCSLARTEDCLKHSRARINAYRALASPCLMALSSPDPLLTAFEMSAKLERLARMEPEYKQDYLKLRTQCQTFATRLLDHTRTSKELEILLNYSDEYSDDHEHSDELGELCCRGSLYEMSVRTTSNSLDMSSLGGLNGTSSMSSSEIYDSISKKFSVAPSYNPLKASKKDSMQSLDSVTGRHESYRSHMRLARLRLAIHCKQKTFCAHPNIQELLATMWYENLPGFRRKNPIAQTVQVILVGLMFPIYSIAYLVAPHSQLGRFIKKPFIKFICHSASYITFLIVILLASQRVEAFYSWSSVISLFSREIHQQQQFQMPTIENNLPLKAPIIIPPTTEYEDEEINKMNFIYKERFNVGSSARGLDSLAKIFEQLPASSKKRGSLPSPIELLILFWVLSLIWAEIKQVRTLGMNYYKSDMWNTLDSVASGFYIATIILRFVSYMQSNDDSVEVAREHWSAYDPTLLSEGLFAAATIFSCLKIVYIFSINPYLGPLQISLGRMIIDILRFSWIYMLVLFSFACGMNQLLWYYADLERHQCLNITNYSLAQYYSAQHAQMAEQLEVPETDRDMSNGTFANITTSTLAPHILNAVSQNLSEESSEKLMEDAFSASLEDDSSKPPVTLDDSCKTWRHFSNVFESTQTLFWATFGLVDLANFDLTGIRQYTRFWALLMFGCYCFINVIVVLNLLIAMMNHSYVKISKKSDVEWKFARTRLWMSYFDTGSTVPAPFNIIPSIKSTINFVKFIVYYTLELTHQLQSNCLILVGIQKREADSKAEAGRTKVPLRSLPSVASKSWDARRERGKRNCNLTTSYRCVMRSLVRRYLVNEQRLLERKRELTEAKLNRWAKSII